MWWVNGEQNNQIMADSRGLAYGDGLFETMRYVKGEIPLLTQHMERLFRGADILGLHINHDVLDVQLRQADQWLSSQCAAQAMLKLMVVRRSTAAGYAPQGERSVDCMIRASLIEPPAEMAHLELRARLCKTPLSVNPLLAGLKHLNRLDQVLASNELSGENEGILLDSAGDVADGISNNVFVVKGKSIFTPPLQNCGVWGVMRTYLLSKATGYSPYTLSEKRISTNDLFNADEILLTNALRGVRNLYAIGDRWQAGATSAGDRLRAMLLDQVHPEFVSY